MKPVHDVTATMRMSSVVSPAFSMAWRAAMDDMRRASLINDAAVGEAGVHRQFIDRQDQMPFVHLCFESFVWQVPFVDDHHATALDARSFVAG